MRVRGSALLLALCAVLACSKTETADPTPSTNEPPPASPLKAAEKLLDSGARAPLFSLLAHTGMSAELQRFLSKPVVVLFCPNLGSTNCESTLLALRDAWFGLRSKLGMVLVVLGEERVRLREYAYANELPFLLLSDDEGAVTRAYGVGTAGSSGVQLFVIAPNKTINTRLPEPSPEAVRQWLNAL